MQPRVMLVDDEPDVTRGLQRALRKQPFRVTTASSAREALEYLDREPVDIVVSDERMPEMPGSRFLEEVRRRHPDTIRIILTGQATLESAVHAINEGGIYRFLNKPCQIDELVACLKGAAVSLQAQRQARVSTAAIQGEEERFKRAMEGLWVALQPIVEVASGGIFAYEGLVRSTEPSIPHGGAFVELAERLDRTWELDLRVREAVAALIPGAPPGIRFFVNLHPNTLSDPQLVAADAPLAPFAGRVVFELTERAPLHEMDGCREQVAALRRCGYSIAVDDLGAGYAGLNSFALLSPDFVKLDLTLIRDVHTTPTKSALVASMADVCRKLGVGIIAEGIETAEEAAHLVELGCPLHQGYWYARPGKPYPKVNPGQAEPE